MMIKQSVLLTPTYKKRDTVSELASSVCPTKRNFPADAEIFSFTET
jgi:hypothetical protein